MKRIDEKTETEIIEKLDALFQGYHAGDCAEIAIQMTLNQMVGHFSKSDSVLKLIECIIEEANLIWETE